MSGFGTAPFGTVPFGSSAAAATPAGEVTINDELGMTETTVAELINVLRDQAVLSSSVTPGARFAGNVAEVLQLDAQLIAVLDGLVNDSALLADVADGVAVRIVGLADSLVLTGAATGLAQALALITDAIAVTDLARLLQIGDLTDSVALAETLEAKVKALETLIASVVLSDSALAAAIVTVLVDETVSFNPSLTGIASLFAVVEEVAEFAVGFVFDDTPYLGIAMNAETKAISEYTNFALNSLATFGNKVYGAGDAGLYVLEGADDDGDQVDWRIRTGLTNLGTGKLKRIEAAYIAFSARGRVVLKVVAVDKGGALAEHWYELRDKTATAPGAIREGSFSPGRGLKANTWAFELASLDPTTDGDALDSLELRPLILERRIP